MLRKRNFFEINSPYNNDDKSDAYDKMTFALRPFQALIRKNKIIPGMQGKSVTEDDLRRSSRKILSYANSANDADIEAFLVDLSDTISGMEHTLGLIDKVERQQSEVKKNKRWMAFADAVESAFSELNDLISLLRKYIEGTR